MSKANGKHKPRGFLKPYGTYMFRTQDPVVDELRTLKADASAKDAHISAATGVATATLSNWWGGKTLRPKNAGVEAVGRYLGKKRVWVDLSRNDRERMSAKTKKVMRATQR